jgi:Ca-activated chloride channel family protein
LARFGRLPALAALTEKRRPRLFLRSLCWTLGISALIVGMAGPRWGREDKPSTAPGRDLVILLDLSRSMLADDVVPANPKDPPSRQQQAKEALTRLVRGTLQKHGGNRVALVAFAARAAVICPLTHDYDHFCEKLAEMDAAQLPLDLRPTEISKSGTRIGAGLRLAVETHDPRFRGAQDILMISDGDDPQARDGEWRLGMEAAKEAGIPVYTVGIGNSTDGGKVPTRNGQTLMHQGKEIITRLQPSLLQEIAKRTHGTYTEAGVDPPRLGNLFRGTIERGPKREMLDDALPSYQQRYAWFFGAALFFLSAEMMLGREGKKKRSGARNQEPGIKNQRSATPVAV